MNNDRFIAVKERRTDKSDDAFVELMRLTEDYLNEKALNDRKAFKSISSSQMENVAESTLKTIAPSVQLNPKNIILVSGSKFPDIVAEKFYGVEVKTTKENKWISTGSSIVESTRIDTVESIYMLFAKFGGDPVEFRCKSYEDCLYEIGVTHAPRYLIDMDLESKKSPTIFQKMNIPYSVFSKLKESEKIKKVQDYYRNKRKQDGKAELQWWIGDDSSLPMNISFYNDLEVYEKKSLRARMFVLFPEMFDNEYKRICLWLCSRYGLLCYNVRDTFSAGGKIQVLGSTILQNKEPQMLKKLYESFNDIKALLKHPDIQLLEDLEEYWGRVRTNSKDLYSLWEKRTKEKISSNSSYTIDPNLLFDICNQKKTIFR